MFVILRGLERWLHQHIFKIGWLVTQNFQTTTILYYTFFLPGVVLHEVVYWLIAGILNIRAEQSLKWPEAQQIGELKLNFVKLSAEADVYRRAIITAAPLIVGLLVIGLIAENIFDFQTAFATISSGELEDVGRGLAQLNAAPDFWLWLYVVFTIANTMWPTIPQDLKGWRMIGLAVVVVLIGLVALGLGGQLVQDVAMPFTEFLGVFNGMLLLLIAINITLTLFLGTLEALIERFTNRSATFRDGQMITMSRAEARAERERQSEQARQRQTEAQEQAEAQARERSIYNTRFPVPGAPGRDEAVTPLEINTDETPQQPLFPMQDAAAEPQENVDGQI